VKTKLYSVAVAAGFIVSFTATQLFAQVPGGPAAGPGGQLGGGAPPAMGQPGGAAAGAQPGFGGTSAPAASRLGVNGVAVVDIAKIFKNHVRFKQQMEEMKGRVEAAENDVKQYQETIKRKADELKTFNPGSPEYKRAENDLLKMQGDLQLKVNLQKKEFMEQERRVYFGISREIDECVKQIAMQNGIVLVLRYNGEPVDPNNQEDVLRGINKTIVYSHPQMDITNYVGTELNRAAGGPPAVGGGNAAGPLSRNPAPPLR
jgi:Skp family chaperone for outer membrane proteins